MKRFFILSAMSDEKKKIDRRRKTETNKQKLFVNFYLQTWNATESARRAGYQGDDKSLAQIGYENLRKLEIRNQIDARLKEYHLSADEVLARLSKMATSDLSPFIDETGNINITSEQAKENIYLVHEYKTKDGVTKSGEPFTERGIKIHDAKDALIHLGRHHKLFTDKFEVDNSKFKKYHAALEKFLSKTDSIESKGESNDETKSES